ncbi:MAG: DUF6717 family protein [Candidatus Methylacidiphilales bacterium]|nr:DUF6717 family protein [Candidatus Methylacidiphilales bacterium]
MNSINIIAPYKYEGFWVFDDPKVGLEREPFVLGIDEMLDKVTTEIPNAAQGFTVIFAAKPFPGYMLKLDWRRAEYEGNWYYSEKLDMEGWLCPALHRYFEKPPQEIYVKVQEKKS